MVDKIRLGLMLSNIYCNRLGNVSFTKDHYSEHIALCYHFGFTSQSDHSKQLQMPLKCFQYFDQKKTERRLFSISPLPPCFNDYFILKVYDSKHEFGKERGTISKPQKYRTKNRFKIGNGLIFYGSSISVKITHTLFTS